MRKFLKRFLGCIFKLPELFKQLFLQYFKVYLNSDDPLMSQWTLPQWVKVKICG